MSAPRALAWLFAPLALAAVGCGEDDPRGSLMLAISTDMYIDKDVSRVDIIVQPERGPTQSAQINLFPGLEGQFLPGTFSIVEGSKPGEFVRIRVIARQLDRVRVVREAALKVPRRRTALLSMPIQWLCDGQVRPDNQLHRSDCEDGYTCITGTCQPDAVDELTLPDYEAEEVFGGGNATGGGDCFETLDCFEGAMQPALDLETCRLAAPVSDDLNVGVVLPLGDDGHCTSSECWIPLDRSSLTGWSEVDGAVQLPAAVCERAATDGARVFASTGCASKLPDTPTCGPWTLVGTTPGGMIPDPNVVLSNPVDNRAVALELATAAERLASEVVAACSALALLSPADTRSIDQLEATCDLAESSITPAAPFTWHRMPTRCWPDSEARLACERSCASDCSPGTLAERCMVGLAGACGGSCESRVCLGTEAVPTACAGGCAGECDGACDGSCVGQCDGSCDVPSPDGFCEGRCTGTCKGLCQGRCEGTCAGRCDLDPMLEAGACSEGTECLGACSAGFDAATCDGPLTPSPCQLQPGCEGNCQVLAQFGAECNQPSVWLMPRSGQDPALAAALDSSLPVLLAIRDRQGPMVLDEAVRLRDRMSADPNVTPDELAAVQADVDLLQRLTSSVTSIFLALGPERSSLPFTPGPVTCDVFRATGAPALIDDFEDGNSLLLPNDGRSGGWHTTQDGTGQLLMTTEPPIPTTGGANGTTKALHLSGSAFTSWGAGFSMDFRPSSAPYDATVHQGVRFWAKGVNQLRVILTQANLSPAHACSTCPTDSEECGIFYYSQVFLSDVWTEFLIPWTSFGHDFQGGAAFGPDQLMTLQFETPGAAAVDFWIDEVSFY